jgi:hypothetical protein
MNVVRRRRLCSGLAVIGVAVVVLPLLVGHAASLGAGSQSLGGNSAAVGRCDTDGVGIVQNLSGANVVSVTVSQIASACGNASISVTLNNGTTNSSGSGTVPAGGGSLTVSLGSAIAAKDGEEIDVSINGP